MDTCKGTASGIPANTIQNQELHSPSLEQEAKQGGEGGSTKVVFTLAPSGSRRKVGAPSDPPPHFSFPSKNSEVCQFQLIFLKKKREKETQK